MTLADVAEYVGVSESTASRALNGRGEMSAETRAAVLEAADVLQFEPSHLARSLRTRTTCTVGFVVPDVSSPFYASALKGAQRALEEAGYRVLLMDSAQAADGEVAALRTLVAHRVDGLLLSTVGIEPDQFESLVEQRGIPCVFFDSALPDAGDGTVLIDNAAGIELLVDHLVAHGHERIGLLTGSMSETSGRERLDAFEQSMQAHGLAIDASHVDGSRWTRDEGESAALRMLERADRPTALVASSVELALGALLAARALGLEIPGDVALATFDDAYFAELLDPPLTAVSYDPEDVGRRAAELLVSTIREPAIEPRDDVVPVTLVTRRSCGCAT